MKWKIFYPLHRQMDFYEFSSRQTNEGTIKGIMHKHFISSISSLIKVRHPASIVSNFVVYKLKLSVKFPKVTFPLISAVVLFYFFLELSYLVDISTTCNPKIYLGLIS